MKTLAILFTTAKADGNKGRVAIGFNQKSVPIKNIIQNHQPNSKIFLNREI